MRHPTLLPETILFHEAPEADRPIRVRSAPRAMAALLALATLSACGGVDPLVCTTEFVYGLQVSVRTVDSSDPAPGTEVTIRDGAYVEVLEELPNGVFIGAGEREGRYEVTVTADGYVSWTRDDVRVRADECHVIPVALEAVLQPAG